MDAKAHKALSAKYKDTLENVSKGGYYRLSMDEFNEIVEIAAYPVKRSEIGCGGCRNRIIRAIARDYTSFQPKRGRPHKIDLDAEQGCKSYGYKILKINRVIKNRLK